MSNQKSRVEQVKEFCLNVRRLGGTAAIPNEEGEPLKIENMSVKIGNTFWDADAVEKVVTTIVNKARLDDLCVVDRFMVDLLRDSNIIPSP